jgi:hypothetical protein
MGGNLKALSLVSIVLTLLGAFFWDDVENIISYSDIYSATMPSTTWQAPEPYTKTLEPTKVGTPTLHLTPTVTATATQSPTPMFDKIQCD